MNIVNGRIAAIAAGVCAVLTGAAALEARGPAAEAWWMRETEIRRDGSIGALTERPWWTRAAALAPGQSFVVPAEGPAKDRMLVRRESLVRSGRAGADALVWIIDDDGDGSARAGGDLDSDCYVVDEGRDGTVDRMVDYIDDDGDGDADALDIRMFDRGRLNWAWFGDDVDDDNVIRNVVAYERGDEFGGDPYGDNLFYLNKYDPTRGVWAPFSECPFAFYDTDGDGFSETVVRVSAAPRSYDPRANPDYANSAYARPWEKAMEDIAVVNVRYSFDVDRGSSAAAPLHYDVGFNLVGSTPYRFDGMRRIDPKRRPPQETVVIPWKDVRAMADAFRAEETGFSWNENVDETVANGRDPRGGDDYRWEGVFWMWERRFMPNTGGPCQKWNMRREWRGTPAAARELYYSEVDRRVHLLGAAEGWIEIGHFAGLGAVGEMRMYDTNRNGFFDRWELYLAGSPRPARVTTVADERARTIDADPAKLTAFYTDDVLPRAIADRRRLMQAMSRVRPYTVPPGLAKAMEAGSPGYRRYAMDVACELQYQELRDVLARQAEEVLRPGREARPSRFMGDLLDAKRSGADLARGRNSESAWRLLRALAALDAAYGRGDTDAACATIDDIARIGLYR